MNFFQIGKNHYINGLRVILPVRLSEHFAPQHNDKNSAKNSPLGRAAFAHLPRYQELAVPKYSCAPECLANERMQLVKYAGYRDGI
jgi:hypothetical protein